MTNDLSNEKAFLVAPEAVEQRELRTLAGRRERRRHTGSGVHQAGPGAGLRSPDCVDVFGRHRRRRRGCHQLHRTWCFRARRQPDQLHRPRRAVEFAKSFFELGKPVAVIRHGPWTLVEADVVRGRTLTSWPSVRTDIINAGGHWVDEGDRGVLSAGPNTLISGRKPGDLPAFCHHRRGVRRSRPGRSLAPNRTSPITP